MRVLAVAVVGGCVHVAPPTMQPDASLAYRTEDGWLNELRHYAGEGPPVLLVHGLGVNHYNWDYREEVSVAAYLQATGWDVWVVGLRGDPRSAHADPHALRTVSFDDYARFDLPAAVDLVLEQTGEDQLYWVGHSMGGMLLYAYLSERPEQVAAGVAICSPATLQHPLPLHRTSRAFAWMIGEEGVVPAQAAAGLSAPLGRVNPLFGKLANRRNLEWPVAHGLARHALMDLPKPLLRQAVDWYDAGAIVDREGRPWVEPADVPILVFGASRDKIVAAADAENACTIFPDCRYTLLSEATGFSFDYGHIDPVVGRSAPREVYPLIGAFLAEQRSQREAEQAGGVPAEQPP